MPYDPPPAGKPRFTWVDGLIALMLFVTLAAIACGSYERHNRQTGAETPAPAPVITPAADGNGVYYFPATGDEYRRALQVFYEEHPTFHCNYQGTTEEVWRPGSAVSYTYTTGHILHCHDTIVDAQSVTVP